MTTEATVRNIPVSLVLLVAVLCFLGCASTSSTLSSLSPVALHLDYRNGGDAPLVFALSFFEDGRARFESPRGKVLWATLGKADREALAVLRTSEAFLSALEELRASGRPFACCDAREVGIFESPTAQPAALQFERLGNTPEPLIELVRMSNSLGKKYFGRHFSLPMPER